MGETLSVLGLHGTAGTNALHPGAVLDTLRNSWPGTLGKSAPLSPGSLHRKGSPARTAGSTPRQHCWPQPAGTYCWQLLADKSHGTGTACDRAPRQKHATLAVAGEPLSALPLESALASEGAGGVVSLPHRVLSEKLCLAR